MLDLFESSRSAVTGTPLESAKTSVHRVFMRILWNWWRLLSMMRVEFESSWPLQSQCWASLNVVGTYNRLKCQFMGILWCVWRAIRDLSFNKWPVGAVSYAPWPLALGRAVVRLGRLWPFRIATFWSDAVRSGRVLTFQNRHVLGRRGPIVKDLTRSNPIVLEWR